MYQMYKNSNVLCMYYNTNLLSVFVMSCLCSGYLSLKNYIKSAVISSSCSFVVLILPVSCVWVLCPINCNVDLKMTPPYERAELAPTL